jgi:hypothetical protein
MHEWPLAQSLSLAQLVRHRDVPPHVKPPGHGVGVPATHAPLPSHVLSVCASDVQLEPHTIVRVG